MCLIGMRTSKIFTEGDLIIGIQNLHKLSLILETYHENINLKIVFIEVLFKLMKNVK